MDISSPAADVVLWRYLRQSHALASADRLRFSPGPAAWSPDGQDIAFYWADEAELHVWYFNLASGEQRRLTSPPFAGAARERTVMDRLFVDRPDWSSRGDQLAVIGRMGNDEQSLYLLDLEGHLQKLIGPPGVPRNPRWSPDGRRIAFVSYRDGKDDLWFVDVATGAAFQLTWDRYDNTDPHWSPNGDLLAYTSQRSDADPLCSQLCVIDLQNGVVQPLPETPQAHSRFARWRDDTHVCFLSDRSGYDEVWEWDLQTGRTEMITRPTGQDKGEFDLRPGRATLVYTATRLSNRSLFILDLRTGKSECLIDEEGAVLWPALSPSGGIIACWRSGPHAPPEIVVVDTTEKEIRRTHTSPSPERPGHVQAVQIPSADGLTIDALLYRPDPLPSHPGPAVLWIHGGPNAQHLNVWEPFFHYLTRRGLTILAPNCRGSTGYGRTFMDANLYDWAGGDARDWQACLHYLSTLDFVDADRLGVWGRSYGGYATLMVLTLFPDLVQAGICQFGPAELISFFHQTSVRHLMVRFMGLPFQQGALYQDRSPLTHLQRIRAPLLILQGDKDVAVPPAQSALVARALAARGGVCEYVQYEGEAHGFDQPAHVLDAASRIQQFWAAHLMG